MTEDVEKSSHVGQYARQLIKLMRPHQWIKNLFVWAPLIFSGRYTEWLLFEKTLYGFICFCLVSSAIYAINDICDREEDRRHPIKKNRPIASGLISAHSAVMIGTVLLGIALVLGYWIRLSFLLTLLIYAVLNIGYSFRLKHIAILDVMTIAAGFVLRVLGGSFATGIMPSHWLILCTMMISLFLGFTKRRAELLAINQEENTSRQVLADYSITFIDQAISMVTGATIVCYALYTVDQRTVAEFDTHAMLLTVPMVIYGLFRYIYIIYHMKEGDDPTGTIIKDFPILIDLLLYVLLCIIIIKYGARFDIFSHERLAMNGYWRAVIGV